MPEINSKEVIQKLEKSSKIAETPVPLPIDPIFERIFGKELYAQIKKWIVSLIDLVESPGNGQTKKDTVVMITLGILQFIKVLPGAVPIWQLFLFKAILGYLVDLLVEALKKLGWEEQKATPVPTS